MADPPHPHRRESARGRNPEDRHLLYKFPLTDTAPNEILGKLPAGVRHLYPEARRLFEARRSNSSRPVGQRYEARLELAPSVLPEYLVEV